MDEFGFNRTGMEEMGVRPSPISGQWYPGAPDRLRAQIQAFLSAAHVEPVEGHLLGLVVPHAGLAYSGGVAAHAYRLVEGLHYEVVVVVAPNHRTLKRDPYLVADYRAYWTPLGEVPVDLELVAALDSRLGLSWIRHDEEHSLEIQLPFLQVVLSEGFRLLPVMFNAHSSQACAALAKALAELLRGRDALLVASTDLSHFYEAGTATRLDRAVTDCIAALDPQGLLDVLERGEGQACGGGATVSVMLAAQALGADHARLLHYATSGDVTGDYHRVVGYAAAALYAAGD